jgi:hypothetical protein
VRESVASKTDVLILTNIDWEAEKAVPLISISSASLYIIERGYLAKIKKRLLTGDFHN